MRKFTPKKTRLVFVGVLVVILTIACVLPGAIAAVTVSDTFRNNSAAGWDIIGDACLSAAGGVDSCSSNTDANGSGWLRLTDTSSSQAGSAIYNTAFSSSDGVSVTFTYATYGGSGNGDGFTFYLIDGSTASPTIGPSGGCLGYARSVSPSTAGVTNGYVGIGFDEYGNFSSSGVGSCTSGCPGQMANSVTIRGSGSLTTGFNYLTRAGTTIATGSRANAKRARITIAPNATSMKVEIDSGSGFVTVIPSFNLSTATGQGALPATFKMGFSGSTGAATNYHEIRDLNIGGAQTSTTTIACSPNPSTVGQTVTCTASVNGAGTTPSGNVDFYNGSSLLGTGPLNGSAQAVISTSSLSSGSYTLRADYGGNAYYGASSASTTQTVSPAPAEAPEPGSLVLLGGGLASVVGYFKLRSVRKPRMDK